MREYIFKPYDPPFCIDPQAKCPCQSGKKAEKCCLTHDGKIMKKPMIGKMFEEPEAGKEYSNNKCYLNFLNTCSSKISREHVISQSVLELFGGKQWGNSTININIKRNDQIEEKSVSFKNAYTTKILCERHNNMLSILDKTMQVFVKKVFEYYKATWVRKKSGTILQLSSIDNYAIFSVYDIERWLVKTFCNLIVSKTIDFGVGNLYGQNIETYARLITDPWEFIQHDGLYIQPTTMPSNTLYTLLIAYDSDEDRDYLVGIKFNMIFFEVVYILNKIEQATGLDYMARHRRPTRFTVPQNSLLQYGNEKYIDLWSLTSAK